MDNDSIEMINHILRIVALILAIVAIILVTIPDKEKEHKIDADARIVVGYDNDSR